MREVVQSKMLKRWPWAATLLMKQYYEKPFAAQTPCALLKLFWAVSKVLHRIILRKHGVSKTNTLQSSTANIAVMCAACGAVGVALCVTEGQLQLHLKIDGAVKKRWQCVWWGSLGQQCISQDLWSTFDSAFASVFVMAHLIVHPDK